LRIHQARELGELKRYRATIKAADLVVIDDLFLRKLPPNAGDELADVVMSRYDKSEPADHPRSSCENGNAYLKETWFRNPRKD